MPNAPFSGKQCRTASGSALVIVLFFVVLLSIVAIAFLSRSLNAIKVSAGSAGEAKSHILASSASDIIIGDFKQEIIAGSTNYTGTLSAGAVNPNSGTVNYPVYTPTANTTAIPFMTGVPAANAIPNLISRSVSPANSGSAPPVTYPSTYTSTLTPPNRAANDSSTKVNSASTSLNGRSVPVALWNEHFLIPRQNPGSGTDSTPVSAFVPPDWVIVTRGGANSVPWNQASGGLTDPTLSNNNYAIGRYAYAVYNEGGLLDMNAAGYPGTDVGSGSVGLTTAQASNKSSLSLADLTQLAVGTTTLTQAQVNNLVGWRNYASSSPPSPGGSFGSFTFTQANASRWLTNFVQGNTNGFMQIVPAPTGVTTPPTDQVFLSRQQLIGVIQSLNINSDFLQYMGSFSRSLEQPSYVANPHLPAITGTSTPPAPASVNSYQGNNTYYGGESAINLRGTAGFMGIRVGTSGTFTRLDGTLANAGEPLIKRKFALSRLALVTTNYGPTFSSASAAAAANDPVYQRFGIYRASATTPWIYDHGIAGMSSGTITPSNGTATPAIIATLPMVATLTGAAGTLNAAREPDFAELLKAAINVGSVGKAGPSGTALNDQYREDTSGDYQILKIMADLIDQQKTDNYPTCIQYYQSVATGVPVQRNIYGDQDLPYFYRWNYFGVCTSQPSPILSSTDTITESVTTGTVTNVFTLNHTRAGSVGTTGTATLLVIPQVWNPHDANTPPASGGGPTKFQIVFLTNISTMQGGTANSAWKITTLPAGAPPGNNNAIIPFDGCSNSGSYTAADCPQASLNTPYTSTLTMTGTNSSLQFIDSSGGKAFREPTLLWRPTSLVSLTGTMVTDALTNNSYYGILIGNSPVSWNWTDAGGKAYFSQTSSLQIGAYQPGTSGGSPGDFDILMQYWNGSSWITYQETDLEYTLTDITTYGLFVNQNETSYTTSSNSLFNAFQNPFASTINQGSPPFVRQMSGLYDPRSNRFTAPVAGSWNSDDPNLDGNPTLDTTVMTSNNIVASANSSVGNSWVLMKTNRPTIARGQKWEYTTPCRGFDSTMHWYSSLSTCGFANGFDHAGTDAACYDGLLSQNNPLVKLLSTTLSTQQSYYYEDPDGICRRAMGGYVPVSGSPTGSLTNTATTIGLPEATSGTATPVNGIEVPSSQSQSRPILLHRPFQSVAEMSYAFRGTPWKSVDFFTPESGDSALLDVFCVNEPPSSALVAGKVDLNTRQSPVLKAILSSAYRDEFANITSPPSSGTLPPLSSTEAGNLASTLVGITTSSNGWEGPLSNIADLVGHFVYPDPGTLSATDVYQYTSPANSTEYTFSGYSAALSAASGIWDASNLTSSQNIQRFRECAIRPLAAAGQTRVWNLLLDIVAQTGHYPKTATGFDQFIVEGQTHLWVHVAIDRFSGQVLDKQVETVTP